MGTIALVGDIGGTNARFALSTPEGLANIQEYKCTDFNGPQAVVKTYLESACHQTPDQAVFAVAGPADDPTKIVFTNGPWNQRPLDFTDVPVKDVEVINDFAAVCYSIALLKPEDCTQIVQGHEPFFPSLMLSKHDFSAAPSRILESSPAHRFVAIGPGTGLGVASGLVTKNGQFLVLGGEGGHASFSPSTETELSVKTYMDEVLGIQASMETMASGSGLVTTFNTIAKVNGIHMAITQASEIPALLYDERKNVREAAQWTLNVFAKTLGSCASSVALANDAQTIFIGGGVVQKLGEHFNIHAFTKEFRNNNLKANNILIDVPVMLVRHPQPGLLGAHAYFQLNR